jgi:diaminohydroxyphosphoribosylaminopyrimidine deaminase/5-amino-6-(5-phosphoribosylamino)uracil reductase
MNETYMSLALSLAEKGRYTVSPNPMVGCVIVKDQRIIGQGYHFAAGQPHAEVFALREAGEDAKDATAYVSLEPCCHVGRTPPCTEALIAAGIKTVYVAVLDPNPKVAGHGVQALQAAGIEVHVGLCAAQATDLNKRFFFYMTQQRPYVISKWTMSLDGRTVTHPQDDRFISSEASFQHRHQLRQSVDAIIVGAKTALQDNPQLTVRHTETVRHPQRFILSNSGSLPFDLNCFDKSLPAKTIVVISEKANPLWVSQAQQHGIELWQCQEKENQIDLTDLLQKMGQAGISSVLVEGGETLHHSFIQENLVNEIQVYVAPKFIGELPQKKTVYDLSMKPLGQEFFIQAFTQEKP